MALRDDLLDLLADREIAPNGSVRAAVADFVAVVREQNPERDPEEDEDDLPADDGGGLVMRRIACPWCGEPVAVELDLGGGDQDALQDCEVCCRPIRLVWTTEEGRLGAFSASTG